MIYNFDGLEFRPISVSGLLHRDGSFEVEGRPYASISVRINGTGEFDVGGKHVSTKRGDVLFMPANTPYRAQYLDSEIIVVHLESCNYFELEGMCLKNSSQIEERFRRLLSLWNERHSVNKTKAVIYDILDRISEDKKTVISDTEFSDCVAYINSHFSDPTLDVDRMCNHGFVSTSTLQRKFHKYFEISPKQYLIRLRMNRALDLLTADELSVREIALACGFSDEKYFSRAFREQYGCSPTQMKKRIMA